MALEQGDPQRAAELADRHLRKMPSRNRTERAAALELLIRARTASGRAADLQGARAALAELASIAAEAQTAALRASASLAAGLIAFAEDDLSAARRHLEDAVDLFETSAAPFETSCARVDLASVLEKLGRTDAAIVEVDRAIEGLTRLNADLALGRARSLRDRLIAPQTARPAGGRDTGVLTGREIEVLRLISSGLSNLAIAERLCISEHTVHRHVANTLSKLNVPSRSAAVAQAARLGLL